MDSLIQSLKYGRLLAASTSAIGAATLITNTANEWTTAAVAILNLIAAVAAIVSKIREMLRNKSQ